jgi:hypothetical protein
VRERERAGNKNLGGGAWGPVGACGTGTREGRGAGKAGGARKAGGAGGTLAKHG